MKAKRISEEVLAAAVVKWLEVAGWNVYQEVQPGRWDGIADIVAIKNKIALIVECKTSLGLSVIEQALRWKGSAEMIAVAVPESRSGQARRSWLAEDILRERGVGLFVVRGGGLDGEPYMFDKYSPEIMPEWNCSLDPRWQASGPWLDIVREGHKTFAKAGSSKGGHLTPFKETMGAMAAFVKDHPGCTRKDIAEGIEHHYANDASFKGAMGQIMIQGWCPGVDERTERNRCTYYPSEAAE